MFDFHMHTTVSYDGHSTPLEMALAAKAAGLKTICFTDHLDYIKSRDEKMAYTVEEYNAAHDGVEVPGLTVLHGAEVGFTPWNKDIIAHDLSLRHYDFVIGSVHFVNEEDPYFPKRVTVVTFFYHSDETSASGQRFDEVFRHVTATERDAERKRLRVLADAVLCVGRSR